MYKVKFKEQEITRITETYNEALSAAVEIILNHDNLPIIVLQLISDSYFLAALDNFNAHLKHGAIEITKYSCHKVDNAKLIKRAKKRL